MKHAEQRLDREKVLFVRDRSGKWHRLRLPVGTRFWVSQQKEKKP